MPPFTLRAVSSLILATLVLPLVACSSTQPVMPASTPPPHRPATVPMVDLPRYMGEWHVIAHIPYFLERGKVDTSDIYNLRPDGQIDNIYQFRKRTFDAPLQQWKARAWVVNKESNAEWKLQFLWPLTTTYLVVDLDPEYRWSVVTIPSRKLIWILARDRALSDTTYTGIVQRLQAAGFETSKLAKVPQSSGN